MANTPVQRNKPSKITFRWLPELERLLLIGMKQGPAAKQDAIDKVLQLVPELTRGKCWQRIRHLRRIAGRAVREARRDEKAKKPVRTGPVRRQPTRPWTTADDDDLLTWAGREPVAKIARRLGRSVHAVRFRLRAHSMSAKVTDGWSLEELRKMLRVSRTHQLRRLIGNGMLRVRSARHDELSGGILRQEWSFFSALRCHESYGRSRPRAGRIHVGADSGPSG